MSKFPSSLVEVYPSVVPEPVSVILSPYTVNVAEDGVVVVDVTVEPVSEPIALPDSTSFSLSTAAATVLKLSRAPSLIDRL